MSSFSSKKRNKRRAVDAVDLYVTKVFSGHCGRLTVPLDNRDKIAAAAIALRQAANELDELAAMTGPTFVLILGARSIIQRANRILKGGAAYKGTR